MVWQPNTPYRPECQKIRHLVVPYTRGRGLDVGCGTEKCWPKMIGIDSGKAFGPGAAANFMSEADDLGMFADSSQDFVFSSHTLEHIDDYRACLAEWWRVIRPDGYLVLYLPHAELYPRMGEPGSNPDHKHDFVPEDITSAMLSMDGGWIQVEEEVRSAKDEYSFFLVFQKKDGIEKVRRPWRRPAKSVLVIRYGGFGDSIQAASILPLLKKQGYHVTFNCTKSGYDTLMADPHIDAWWLQDGGQVPNPQLMDYWRGLEERFDRVINLCESVEAILLPGPGNVNHGWPLDVRQKMLGSVNYLERCHDMANLPHEFGARFYAADEEKAGAAGLRATMNGPVVMYCITGSAPHKTWPWMDRMALYLLQHTDAHILFVGDEKSAEMQEAIFAQVFQNLETDEARQNAASRLHGSTGAKGQMKPWTIRQTLTFAELCDVVVGPETGVLNGVGLLPEVDKVVMLSHSSAENLTKHWKSCTVLAPIGLGCHPCHRLHSTFDYCNEDEETGAAKCASMITAKRATDSVIYRLTKRARARAPRVAAE